MFVFKIADFCESFANKFNESKKKIYKPKYFFQIPMKAYCLKIKYQI